MGFRAQTREPEITLKSPNQKPSEFKVLGRFRLKKNSGGHLHGLDVVVEQHMGRKGLGALRGFEEVEGYFKT